MFPVTNVSAHLHIKKTFQNPSHDLSYMHFIYLQYGQTEKRKQNK